MIPNGGESERQMELFPTRTVTAPERPRRLKVRRWHDDPAGYALHLRDAALNCNRIARGDTQPWKDRAVYQRARKGIEAIRRRRGRNHDSGE